MYDSIDLPLSVCDELWLYLAATCSRKVDSMNCARVTLLCALVLMAGLSHACIDYGEAVHYVGGVATGRTYHDLDSNSDHAVIVGDGVLTIVDIRDRPSFRIVSTLSLPGTGTRDQVTVAGSVAYVARGNALLIVDFTDAANPHVAAQLDFVSLVRDVAVSTDIAYVATSDSLFAVDVADAPAPGVLGSHPRQGDDLYGYLDASGTLVAAVGRFYYWPTFHVFLEAVDFSDPVNPVSLGRRIISSGSYEQGIDVSSNRAGVIFAGSGSGPTGFSVVDLSDPSSLTSLGGADLLSVPSDVVISGERGYVSFGTANPLLVFGLEGAVEPQGSLDPVCRGSQIVVDDDIILVDALSAYLLGHRRVVPSTGFVSLVGSDQVALVGDVACITSPNSLSLDTVDVSDPRRPTVLGSVGLAGVPYRVVGVGAYVAVVSQVSSYACKIEMLSLAEPSSPMVTGSADITPVSYHGLDGRTVSVATHGEYLYVTSDQNGLDVVDIADVSGPAHIATVAVSGGANGVAVHEDTAYVTSADGWLTVLDLASPGSPSIHARVDVGALVGGSPALVGVAVHGDTVMVFYGDATMASLNLQDPANPIVISQTTFGYVGADDWVVVGDLIYLPGIQSVLVVDMSDAAVPTIVGGTGTRGSPRDVEVLGDLVFVATSEGLQILPGHCVIPTSVGNDGMAEAPLRRLLAHNQPNPFNPSTTISWSLPAAADATLEIYDSMGRHVVTLVDGRVDAGPGSVVWHGRDSTGATVSSGVYFYCLTAGDFADTKRMILIK